MPTTDEVQRKTMVEADAFCADNPTEAGVRDELLRINAHLDGHGFDVRDINHFGLFQVVVNPATHQAESMLMGILSTVVAHFVLHFETNYDSILDMVTSLIANPELSPVPMPEQTRLAIETSLREYKIHDGWEFYGVGVTGQAMSIAMDHPDAGAIAAAADVDHPDVQPLRYLHLASRNARLWTLYHQQGREPVYGTCGPDEPIADVPQLPALMRLNTAIAGE